MQYAGRLKEEIALRKLLLIFFFFFFCTATHAESEIEMAIYIMIFKPK